MTVVGWMIVIGAALEAIGLGLTVLDLRQARARAYEHFSRLIIGVAASLVDGRRVQRWRRDVAGRSGPVTDRLKAVEDDVRRLADDVDSDVREIDSKLADLSALAITDLSSSRRRYIGVGLFVSGLIVNTIGNVLSI